MEKTMKAQFHETFVVLVILALSTFNSQPVLPKARRSRIKDG